jgi:hypothetical protein
MKMNETQAVEYVDLIIEQLYAWGVISEHAYGTFTDNRRHEPAERSVRKSGE